MDFWRKFEAFSSHLLPSIVDNLPEVTSELEEGGFLITDLLSLKTSLSETLVNTTAYGKGLRASELLIPDFRFPFVSLSMKPSSPLTVFLILVIFRSISFRTLRSAVAPSRLYNIPL